MKPILKHKWLREKPTSDARPSIRRVTINAAESPLGWLFNHRRIAQHQFDAGEMLRRDFTRAGLAPHVTMDWGAAMGLRARSRVPDDAPQPVAAIDAARRFDEAIRAAGPGLADILWRVVCAGEAVPAAERALGWPLRAGRLVLTLALDRVADYYRLR